METVNEKEGRFFEDMKYVKNKRKQLLASHKQFSDKDFPTEIAIEATRDRVIHWKRILDLDDKARLFAEPNALFGAMELGLLNNSNFVAVITAVWNHRKLLNYVFPPGQDFNSPDYCGFFYFRFWKMGKWVYVIVDDKVPILGGKKVEKVEEPKKKPDKQKKTPGTSEQTSQSSNPPETAVGMKESDGPTDKPNESGTTMGSSDFQKEKDGDNMREKLIENDSATAASNDDDSTKVKTNEIELKQSGKGVSEGQSEASVSSKKKPNDPKISANRPSPDTKKSKSRKPIYLQVVGSREERFYWATLFEKAYAKFCGGYHLLEKKNILETILDITGGIVEVFYTKYLPAHFFLSLKNFNDTRSIVLATSNIRKRCKLPSTYNFWEEEEIKGEEEEQSFLALTQVVFADFQKLLNVDKMMGFVRLRNPYGSPCWANDWMEASREWEMLPADVKKKLQMVSNDPGEFYLTYDNLLKAFPSLLVSTVSDGDNFNCEGYFGLWTRPRLKYDLCNLGQLRFHDFPQHKVWVRDPNCDDNLNVEVIISLLQNGSCCCSEGSSLIGIMFFVFCLDSGRTYTLPLSSSFFRYNKPIGCSNYSTEKEISGRFDLPPGPYLVVAVPDHTNLDHPCLANEYLLRVVTPAKFPKPPPPHMAVTFCESENLNIYFNYAEMIEAPKTVVTPDAKEASQTDSARTSHKDKGNKAKKKKTKH